MSQHEAETPKEMREQFQSFRHKTYQDVEDEIRNQLTKEDRPESNRMYAKMHPARVGPLPKYIHPSIAATKAVDPVQLNYFAAEMLDRCIYPISNCVDYWRENAKRWKFVPYSSRDHFYEFLTKAVYKWGHPYKQAIDKQLEDLSGRWATDLLTASQCKILRAALIAAVECIEET